MVETASWCLPCGSARLPPLLPAAAPRSTGTAMCSWMSTSTRSSPACPRTKSTTTLGSPDTTSTIGGDAYYYISTTQKSYAFFKPWEIDRKVVAVYFNRQATVRQRRPIRPQGRHRRQYAKDETPARGKDLGVLEQIFGNISQRKMFKDQDPGRACPEASLAAVPRLVTALSV